MGGGLFFITVAAPAAFRGSPTRTAAADVVGLMLSRWHYIALLIPAALIIVEWKRGFPRDVRWALLVTALFLAAAESVVDLRIRAIRMRSAVPISQLEPSNPMRRQFGILHGLSTVLAGANVLAGIILLMRRDADRHEREQEPPAVHAGGSTASVPKRSDDLDRPIEG